MELSYSRNQSLGYLLPKTTYLSEPAAAAAAAAAVYSTTTDDAEEAPEADGIHDRVVEWWVDWLFRRFI
jgi:hypothetical protein